MAHRSSRVLTNVLRWLRLVSESYFAFTAQMYDNVRLLHKPLPDATWDRMRNFQINLATLTCWVGRSHGATVFVPKQNNDFWERVFETGKTPSGVVILTQPLDLQKMIHATASN